MTFLFKWDGTDITHIIKSKEIVVQEAIWEDDVIWIFKKDNVKETCLVRCYASNLPCLIDEIKPVFGISKNHTHWGKWKGRYLIFTKPNIQDQKIVMDISLNKVNMLNSLFIYEIRNIFLFREILGISRSNEKSINVRIGQKKLILLSAYEPNMNPSKNQKILSNAVLNKWFGGVSLDSFFLSKFGIQGEKDITPRLFRLRSSLEPIVNRVDKTKIDYVDLILNRIRHRLCTVENGL